MPVPHHHFIGPAAEKAVHCRIDLTGEQLAHLDILGLSLVLPADPAHPFSVGNQEHGFLSLRPQGNEGD